MALGTRPAPAVDPRAIGARIRELREALGLTQFEVARRSGVHRPNIARLERGKHTVSLDTIVRVTWAMGVLPSQVLCILDGSHRPPDLRKLGAIPPHDDCDCMSCRPWKP